MRPSQRSLDLFNKHAGMKLEVKVASVDALDVVKSKTTRVCPLVCDHGFRADGERCMKISCGTGSIVNDDNACEKKRVAPRKPEAKQATARRSRTDFTVNGYTSGSQCGGVSGSGVRSFRKVLS